MIRFLYGCSTGDPDEVVVLADGSDATVDEIVGSTDATDSVVNFPWAVQGQDDVVEERGYFLCALWRRRPVVRRVSSICSSRKKLQSAARSLCSRGSPPGENDLSHTELFQGSAGDDQDPALESGRWFHASRYRT